MKIEFVRQLLKNIKASDLMKIPPMVTQLFRAERRTDGHDQANSHFSLFRESA